MSHVYLADEFLPWLNNDYPSVHGEEKPLRILYRFPSKCWKNSLWVLWMVVKANMCTHGSGAEDFMTTLDVECSYNIEQ